MSTEEAGWTVAERLNCGDISFCVDNVQKCTALKVVSDFKGPKYLGAPYKVTVFRIHDLCCYSTNFKTFR